MNPAVEINLNEILALPCEPGRVERVVGNEVVYVILKGGGTLGLRTWNVRINRDGEVQKYRGEPLQDIGLVAGAKVDVYGSVHVVVGGHRRRGLFRRILDLF